ncbi:hypothetical protein LRS71_09425 [Rhodococcus pyridinivorans]|uniref:hypothetical protein n=1 Tax=Rhodococcus pyridinivorans TaxID=103816 RepID=UPI001E2FB0C3|nr:hypothetical protein [Rhodococcus pyridinivorans]MCD5419773.1 hypothetical protein [Rhodococcus pyridinivorans]
MKIAFLPSGEHEFKLSTLRGSVDPKEAFRRHTEDEDLESAGTWALSVESVLAANLVAYDDSNLIGKRDHTSVDFNGFATQGQKIKAARKLRNRSQDVDGGCLYRPERGNASDEETNTAP